MTHASNQSERTETPERARTRAGALLLTSASCADGSLRLPAFAAPPPPIGLPKTLLVGAAPPSPLPRCAAAALALLLAAEFALLGLLYGSVCPLRGAAPAAACAASLLVLPAASVLSPLAALHALVVATRALLGVHRAARRPRARSRRRASMAASDAALEGGERAARLLRRCLVWNACSMPNALLLLAAFLLHDVRAALQPRTYGFALLLLLAKLMQTQALKELAAASGINDRLWRLLGDLARRGALGAPPKAEE